MIKTLNLYFLAFIPLLVAINPVGLIPFFLGVTQGMEVKSLQKVAFQATLTSAAIAILFLFLGKIVFYFLGISVYDFQIAGGFILFALAAKNILRANSSTSLDREDIGIVPLGTPLIAGPALITTLFILVDNVGISPTLLALFSNFILVVLVFRFAPLIAARIGISGLKALSKIVALLLSAIAVHMIHQGFIGYRNS